MKFDIAEEELERVEPKVGTGLRPDTRQNKDLEHDGDSKKSHLAQGSL